MSAANHNFCYWIDVIVQHGGFVSQDSRNCYTNKPYNTNEETQFKCFYKINFW